MKTAKKAGVNPSDSEKEVAKKIKIWVSNEAPDLTPSQIKGQGQMAYNAIMASFGRSTLKFEKTWRDSE